MPIIRRAQINKFKEVLISESAGLIQDSLGTYTLDNPSTTPNGTGDFLGVIKTAVLLGQVEIHTVDTRNFTIAQFNNLTQQEFDNYVRVGLIRYNQPTGMPERLGWVEMGRTNASFYYETCPGGKRPVSEHYYDMVAFAFDNKLVYGEGLELIPSSATAIGGPNTPLTPIGNFDPNWYTNMGPIAPRFDPLSLPQYMSFSLFNNGQVINSDGEVRGISAGMYSSQSRPLRKNILFANRDEHFDNRFATEITPGKWGSVRGVIEQSIVANVVRVQNPITGTTVDMDFGLSKGECLQIATVTPSGGTTTTVTTGGPTPPVMVGGGGITTTPATGGPTPPPPTVVIGGEQPDYDVPISKRWDTPKIVGISNNKKLEGLGPIPPLTSSFDQTWTTGVQNRALYQIKALLDGWRDPRTIVNENLESPPGEIYGSFNSKTDEFVIKPAILREPIIRSIQDKVGANRSCLGDMYRRNCLRMYTLSDNSYVIRENNIGPYKYSKIKPIHENGQLMFSIGDDELGNPQFSDSDSFRERCIFTGYNRSFENRIDVSLGDLTSPDIVPEDKLFWGKIVSSIKNQSWNNKKIPNFSNKRLPITYVSKSGRYFTSSPPATTLFLGYYEEDVFKTLIPSTKRPTTGDSQFAGSKTVERDWRARDRKSYSNKLNEDEGTFREILTNYVYKNDIIFKKVNVINDTGVSIKKNILSPRLPRRSEFYGPSPFQHILYADFLLWERYLTNYDFKWTYRLDPTQYGTDSIRDVCGRFMKKYGWRAVPLSDRFEQPMLVSSEDYPDFYWIEIKDKTRILDVYFGLMEMHIKGYPWTIIFEVMDKLPNGYREAERFGRITPYEEIIKSCGDKNFFTKMKVKYDNIVKQFDDVWNYMLQKNYIKSSNIASKEDISTNVLNRTSV